MYNNPKVITENMGTKTAQVILALKWFHIPLIVSKMLGFISGSEELCSEE